MKVAPSLSRKSGSLAAHQEEKAREMMPLEARKLEKQLRAATEAKTLKTENVWQKTPVRKPGTYAEKYLSDYKSRWMMKRNCAASTRQAIQSVMSRHQDFPTFQNHQPPAKQS